MESKTPRTDDREFAAIDLKPSSRVVYASFARQLETELARANELLLKTNQTHIENQQLRKDLDGEREINQRLTDEIAEVRAEIERKNALIEQMRKALGLLCLKHVEVVRGHTGWNPELESEMVQARAALSAAERGE